MSFSEGVLTGDWLWLLHGTYLLALLVALWHAPWRILNSNIRLQHLLMGGTVALMAMWALRAGISPGLSIHFLGITVLTLVFGWDLAILAASLALLGMTLLGLESWQGFSASAVTSILIPVAVSYGILRFVEWKLPRNFFVYLSITAFIGSGIAVASAGLSSAALLWLNDVYSWEKIQHEYVIYLPLIMVPEALLCGGLMTGLMVFMPDWLRTFDSRVYIDEG